MIKKILISIFFLFTAIIAADILSADENWNEEFTKEGITVYTRPVEGSSLKEFKGTGIVNAPMEVCFNVLYDVENQTRWMPDCIAVKLIKRDGSFTYAYNETKAPWPVSNRDVVTKTEISKEKDRIVFSFIAVNDPGLVPLKKKVVRIKEMAGTWTFVREGDKTIVTYRAKINPGGSLPAWLANSTATDQPFKSLLGLRKMVMKPEYQLK